MTLIVHVIEFYPNFKVNIQHSGYARTLLIPVKLCTWQPLL